MDLPYFHAGQLCDFVACPKQLVLDCACPPQKRRPGRSGDDPLGRPLEQCGSERTLNLADAARDGGLRDPQLPRRAAKAAGFRNGDNVADVIKLDPMHPAPLLGFLWLAAIAPFTERGQADFDVFLDVLNPGGAWTETEPGKYAYHPYDAQDAVPFTRGRWAYTDFGWTWIGDAPGSFATDHYGVWVLDDKGAWAWKPAPLWHPAPVDFRQTKDRIGWRPSKMDVLHQLTEKDDERFARPEEWIWVAKEKFAQPLTPADVVTGAAGKDILADSAAVSHVFKAWREIDRPGPDPAGILPPARIVDDSQRKENQPSVLSETLLVLDPWWQEHPAPKALEIYLYRPDLYQDADGIQRRIHKWYHPGSAAEQQDQVNKVLQQIK